MYQVQSSEHTYDPQRISNTNPGGWVECIDLDLAWTSPDASLTSEHASLKFNHEFLKACRTAHMDPCPGPSLKGWMTEAGFVDVKAEKFVLPVGTWPADKHLVRNCLMGSFLFFP